MEIILGISPIISPELEKMVIYSSLNELYLHHNKAKLFILNNFEDVTHNVKILSQGEFIKHTIIKYSRFFQQMSASLTDFLMGYFEKDKYQIRYEATEFSAIKGNYNNSFDEYSTFFLVNIFLEMRKMVVIGKEIFYKETNEFAMSVDKLLFVELVAVIQDRFFYQSHLLDLSALVERNKNRTLNLLESKYGRS